MSLTLRDAYNILDSDDGEPWDSVPLDKQARLLSAFDVTQAHEKERAERNERAYAHRAYSEMGY